MAVILASQSPRRQELLKRILPEFKVIPADINEEIQTHFTPNEYVLAMATQKAKQISKEYPLDLVIGCDTIVTINEIILGKPSSREQAFQMLKKLSGKKHLVYTSVVLLKEKQELATTVPAIVEFYTLSDQEINNYLDKDSYSDKAGAYGIQDDGALFVKGIEGDFYTIMGLPLATLYRMLPAIND